MIMNVLLTGTRMFNMSELFNDNERSTYRYTYVQYVGIVQ